VTDAALNEPLEEGSALPSADQADGPTPRVVGPPAWNLLFDDLIPAAVPAGDESASSLDAETEGGHDDEAAS
jgi:hypothetical protein